MKKGFSLIELMVVVAIVGVISAIAVPAYQNYQLKAKIAKAFLLLKNFSESTLLQYEKTGSWPSSVSWGGTTFTNGTQVATSSNLRTSGIYYGQYSFNGNVAAFFISVSGLTGISGYEDPQTSGNGFFSQGSLLSIRVKVNSNGSIVMQCGTGVPGDSVYVPISYQPSICSCQNLNDYFVGGTICTP